MLITALLTALASAEPRLIAHRGLGQTFSLEGVTGTTCTATRIHAPAHPHLENTLAGIAAAFAAGADRVEIDIQPTADGQVAVFHDATLDCRTDGTGPIRAQTMDALRALDAGYGYTADGGASYPLRGAVGQIPSLDEVLDAFPGGRFILEMKTRAPGDAALVASVLAARPAAERAALWLLAAPEPGAEIEARFPEIRTLSRSASVRCAKDYLKQGWRRVPESCHSTVLFVPINRAWLLWGYPRRMSRRLAAVDTEVVLIGPWYRGEKHARGVDEQRWANRIPRRFDGHVWTNRIDLLGAPSADDTLPKHHEPQQHR